MKTLLKTNQYYIVKTNSENYIGKCNKISDAGFSLEKCYLILDIKQWDKLLEIDQLESLTGLQLKGDIILAYSVCNEIRPIDFEIDENKKPVKK